MFADAELDPNGQVPDDFFDELDKLDLATKLRAFVDKELDAIREISRRVAIGHMSWAALDRAVEVEIDSIAEGDFAGETLRKLLVGFRHAIRDHRGAIAS